MYTFSVAGDRPSCRSDCRNSSTLGTEKLTGSSPLSKHHAENNFHLFSYWTLVEGALAFNTVLQTASVQLVSSGSGPAVTRPIAADGEGRDAKFGPLT